MKRMEVAKWLKGITIILGLMGAVFFFLILPMMAGEMKTAYPEVAFLYWPGMCYGWLIGVLCYLCLYQFWKVCTEISRDNSFSKENAKSFVVISRLTLIIAAIFFAGVLFLAVNRWLNPGIMIFMLKGMLYFIVIAILAAALSHLILKAYELKQENELTI